MTEAPATPAVGEVSSPTAARGGRPVSGLRVVLIVAAVVVVMIGAVLWFWSSTSVVCATDVSVPSSAEVCGIPTPLALGSVQVGSGPQPTIWYENISIVSAASALTPGDLNFSVQTGAGGLVTAPAGSEVLLIGTTGPSQGGVLGTYEFSEGSWSGVAPGTSVNTDERLSLEWADTSATDPLTGDVLIVTFTDGYEGTVVAHLE